MMKTAGPWMPVMAAALAASIAAGCAPPDDEGEVIVTSITGRVLDAETDDPIANALVQTEPFVKQAFTTGEGLYTIEEGLTPGRSYRVTASKSGYEDNSVSIASVQEGTNMVADILLTQAGPRLSLSASTVQIAAGESAGTVRVENAGDTSQPLTFNVSTATTWITELSPESGTVTDIPQTLTIRIDRAALPAGSGDVTGNVEVSSNGGAETVTVSVLR